MLPNVVEALISVSPPNLGINILVIHILGLVTAMEHIAVKRPQLRNKGSDLRARERTRRPITNVCTVCTLNGSAACDKEPQQPIYRLGCAGKKVVNGLPRLVHTGL